MVEAMKRLREAMDRFDKFIENWIAENYADIRIPLRPVIKAVLELETAVLEAQEKIRKAEGTAK